MIGDVDGLQAGMGNRASHESGIAHAGKAQVANILAAAVKETLVFFSLRAGADTGFSQGSRPNRSNG